MKREMPVLTKSMLALVAMMPVAAARGAITTTVSTLKDAMIFGKPAGGDTGNASGVAGNVFAGADGSGNIKRSLLQFNLSSIPAYATITSVSMSLTIGNVAGSGGGSSPDSPLNNRTFGLYDLLQNWGEGPGGLSPGQSAGNLGGTGQGTPASNGDSTWDYAFYNTDPSLAVKWNNGTTNIEGGNFANTPSNDTTFTADSTHPFAAGQTLTWQSTAGMIADVQNWVDGTNPNFGWLLKSENLESTPTSFLGFWTKEGAAATGNAATAPMLTITYSVPEPSTFLLSAIVFPFLTRRMKRGR
ncbi:MAG TPA: hypothetical protein VFE58_17195 [Tepidisphaeraceae bacterium]|jgi:hypothetical protein|nr:hypothetical protein [Tepidisphaeraceae bacterium]